MRDQEIEATAKDLEMRQLELESQKRLYEKVEGKQRPPSLKTALSCAFIVSF